MTKAELSADLRRFCGGSSFCKRKDVAAFLGYSDPHHADKYLRGLERVGNLYFIPDVVERLLGG